MAGAPKPFTIQIDDAALAVLKQRLERVRWPDEIADSAWDYGTNMAYLRQVVDYWRTQYDWRPHERELNRFHHYKAEVDGLNLHFIHERGQGANPLPLILIHGWPGSFYEFPKVIGPLFDPQAHGGNSADSFDLVVPSIPGFVFSEASHERGLNVPRVAELFDRLMTDVLGYSRYAAAGGDWGSIISSRLAFAYPERVLGIHVSMPAVFPHQENMKDLSEEERAFLGRMGSWREHEAAYQAIQGTKPQTLGYGLTDSPVGLAGWLVEKYRAWSECDGDLDKRFTKDELLTHIMLYWLSGCINSSIRIYYESRHNPWALGKDERINVPTAVTAFPGELVRPPKKFLERVFNLQQHTEMPKGGHFPAFEEPELFVEDVRKFFRTLR